MWPPASANLTCDFIKTGLDHGQLLLNVPTFFFGGGGRGGGGGAILQNSSDYL